MTVAQREAIADYVEKVGRAWRAGDATEHTYRPLLKTLVETLLTNFDAAIFAKICAAVNDAPCLQASANTVRNDDRLAYYRSHELGKTWYDVADCAMLENMESVRVEVPDPNADRNMVKEVFRVMKPVRNDADGRVVTFPITAAKKLMRHPHLNVFGLAKEYGMLFARSRRLWSESAAEIPNHREHRNVVCYHHYVAKAEWAGESVYVRFTVREGNCGTGQNELHGTLVSRIAVYKAKGVELSDPSHAQGEDSTPFVDNKIALFLSAVNGVENREEVRGKREEVVEPADVFNYIYGVLHTPSYRERYREFLKIDFPRIPYPKDAAEFRRVAAVGEKLVRVHLLKDEAVTNPFANPYAKFAGAGDGIVEKVVFQSCTSGEDAASPFGCVYINGGQWFESVPEAAWNFYVGGYQPAQKWLKDRKGRTLTSEDLQHYRAIIAALVKTAALMRELELGNEELGIKNEELKE